MAARFSTGTRYRLAGAVCIALCVLGVEELKAAVSVETAEGRELVGEIDERTNEERLWIRREANQIVLTTSVPWASIVAAAVEGKPAEVSTLAQTWQPLKNSGPSGIWSLAKEEPSEFSRPPTKPRPTSARIAALEIDAVLVNLDRDVEPDGFELVISALDVHGRAVPVRGTISARLVGERDEAHLGRIQFEELQRWSQPVVCADFQDGMASYALRFRKVRPEWDWELIPYALLNVRLGVYGEGNFEASIPVMIRQFNPFRDQLQKYERSRFLRNELSEEVRRRGVAWPGAGLQGP